MGRPSAREHRGPPRPGARVDRALMRAVAFTAIAVLASVPVATARAAGSAATFPVELPTAADAIAAAIGIERLLNGARGIETRLPGPVTDRESVAVAFGLDGAPVAVTDE